MNFEKIQRPIQGAVPKPIKKLIGNVVEVAQDTFSTKHHLARIMAEDAKKTHENQKAVAHALGMSACHAIKSDEPYEDHLLDLKIAMSELPMDVSIWNIGFSEEQLAILGQHFEPLATGINPYLEI